MTQISTLMNKDSGKLIKKIKKLKKINNFYLIYDRIV